MLRCLVSFIKLIRNAFAKSDLILFFIFINEIGNHKCCQNAETPELSTTTSTGSSINSQAQMVAPNNKYDERGYIIYCPCMGRFGNQADHFLGSLYFAKTLDRTLVLPPWRTYKNVPFNEFFKVSPLKEFHRVILAEDFMKYLSPVYWPPARRKAWCWLPADRWKDGCRMKEGNPFGPFWDGLGVDFVEDIPYQISYQEPDVWKQKYPAHEYPVIAMRGAPASFPVNPQHRMLQKYLKWSDDIISEADQYINKTFNNEKFIGIHLRNNVDWESACKHTDGIKNFMASPQCLENSNQVVTSKLCFPPKDEILRLTKNTVLNTKAKHIFVATDKNPMIKDLENYLQKLKVKVYHLDPWLPQIDLAILAKSHHFIGNCVSSFTAFVKRERDVHNKPTSFWGFS